MTTATVGAREGGAAVVAARVLMAAIFLIAGVRKLMTYGATLGYFAKLGIPCPTWCCR